MPRVSCLTVTLGTPERLPMLARAIAGFAAQTHANRELVIVSDAGADRAALTALVDGAGRDDVRLVLHDGRATLGTLRNLSVEAAAGEIVCQWDDDDLYHPRRIEAQLAAMEAAQAKAVILQEVIAFRPDDSVLRCANWAATPAGGHPGTLIARRAAMLPYPVEGAAARLGEDLDLLLRLAENGHVHRLSGEPFLYLYVSHGANSWPSAHHAMLADTLAVSAGLLRRREVALRQGLAPFDLDAGVRVEGSNGLAFLL